MRRDVRERRGRGLKEEEGVCEVRKRSLALQSLSNSLLIAGHSFCRTLINRGESGSASLFNQRLLFKDLGDSTRAPRGELHGDGESGAGDE